MVSLINSSTRPLFEIGLIIDDILALMNGHLHFKVCFVPYKANMAAHCLTKLGVSLVCDRFWMEEFPPCVAPIRLFRGMPQ